MKIFIAVLICIAATQVWSAAPGTTANGPSTTANGSSTTPNGSSTPADGSTATHGSTPTDRSTPTDGTTPTDDTKIPTPKPNTPPSQQVDDAKEAAKDDVKAGFKKAKDAEPHVPPSWGPFMARIMKMIGRFPAVPGG